MKLKGEQVKIKEQMKIKGNANTYAESEAEIQSVYFVLHNKSIQVPQDKCFMPYRLQNNQDIFPIYAFNALRLACSVKKKKKKKTLRRHFEICFLIFL